MDAIQCSLEFKDTEFYDDRLHSIKICQKEYQGRKTQSLNEFRSLLTASANLHPCLEEHFLLRFLRGAKHRPKTALKRLERYYYHRSLHPEIFRNYVPSNTLSAQALNHITLLPYRSNNLSPVVIFKLGLTDFQRVSFEEVLRLDLLVLETLLINPVTQLSGITVIIDFNRFPQSEFARIVTWLPTCYHVFHSYCTFRIKYVHVINTPALLHLLYQNILSSFSDELRKRIMFYPVNSDLEELQNQVSQVYVPEEYGGKLSSSRLVNPNLIVNQKEDYFRDQMQYGLSRHELG